MTATQQRLTMHKVTCTAGTPLLSSHITAERRYGSDTAREHAEIAPQRLEPLQAHTERTACGQVQGLEEEEPCLLPPA